ncbi:MAG: RNHCP domain-containing protein [bacterium]
MENKKFQRKIEDFTCEHCGFLMRGTGYTNHCSECLWSKHVDINPGDRAADCGGMMEPIGLSVSGSAQSIIQKCVKCGHKRRNKVEVSDNIDAVIKLSTLPTQD